MIGGGITGCSVAYHLAKAGWRDVLLVEKGQLTSGSTCHAAGLVTQFNPSPTMMRFRRYSVELYRELGVFDTFGSLRIASSEESLAELRRGASRARGIGLDVEVLGPDEALEVLPAASARVALRRRLDRRGRLRRSAHRDPHAGRRGPRPGRADRHLDAGHRASSWTTAAPCRRPHRPRADRDRARGQRVRHLGAAGVGDGRRVHAVGAGRPPAHRADGGARPRAAARHALLPRHRQPGLRPLRGGRRAVRRVRARPGRALGRRRAVEPLVREPAGRRAAVRAAVGRRGAPLPVPRGRRHGHAGVPSRRDDARTATRCWARCPACPGSGWPPASR